MIKTVSMFLLLTLPALGQAVKIGDSVELEATHSLGVPLHREPRSSMFDRVGDGEVVRVVGVAQSNRWFQVAVGDGRAGWIVEKYIGRVVASEAMVDAAEDELAVWSSPKGCKRVSPPDDGFPWRRANCGSRRGTSAGSPTE